MTASRGEELEDPPRMSLSDFGPLLPGGGRRQMGASVDLPVLNRIYVGGRAVLPLLAVLVTLGLSGCGTPGAEATPSPAPGQQRTPATSGNKPAEPALPSAGVGANPCALVSRPEAEKLAGTSLNSPVLLAETCTYTAPPSGPTAQVEVFVGETAENYLTAERGIGHDLRPLSGVGDEAYIEDGGIFVNKAGRWVSVKLVRSNDPAENNRPLEDLARTVSDRI